MLTREVLRAVRQIVAAVDLAGMDIVEVSPPYDQAETTAMAANRVALEAISALARPARRTATPSVGRTDRRRLASSASRSRDRRRPRPLLRPRSRRRPRRSRPVRRARRADGRPDPRAGRRHRPARGAARCCAGTGSRRSTSTRRCSSARDARAADAGLDGTDRLEFVEADLVGCACPTPGRYGLAFIALNSLLVLEVARRPARRARDAWPIHLAPGGVAAVDVWLPDAEDLAPLRRTDHPRVAAATTRRPARS